MSKCRLLSFSVDSDRTSCVRVPDKPPPHPWPVHSVQGLLPLRLVGGRGNELWRLKPTSRDYIVVAFGGCGGDTELPATTANMMCDIVGSRELRTPSRANMFRQTATKVDGVGSMFVESHSDFVFPRTSAMFTMHACCQ